MEFIDILSTIMRKKNINSYTLQNETGLKESTFRGWKKGSQPSADKIILLSNYLKISADELLGLKPIQELSENDKEILELFRKLPEREQIKLIGKVEELVKNYKGEIKE